MTGMVMEAVGTFILMFVVLCLVDQSKAPQYSMVIGFVVGLDILAIGEITGSSVNPFRYAGPALVSGRIGDAFMYLVAPCIGSVIAAFVHDGAFALTEGEKEDIRRKNEYAKSVKID